jgi:anti-sigma regulatory factor (Ser/Thr protein kinase)
VEGKRVGYYYLLFLSGAEVCHRSLVESKKMLDLSPDTHRATAPTLIGLTFNLPEALPYIISLRKTVRCLLDSMGVLKQDTDDLEAIIGELATNAVRHAKGGNYQVTIEFCGDQVTIIVTDNGVGFMIDGIAEPGTLRPDELSAEENFRIGGFGLLLVRSLSDEVDISKKQPNGMIVRLHKTIRRTSRPAS